MGLGGKLLTAFAVFWALFLISVFMPLDVNPTLGTYMPLLCGLLALALTFGFYATRRVMPPQTSYYQPVTLKAAKQEFSGRVVGITLRCSNATFARKFSSANAQAMAAGVLAITAS